MTRELYSNAWRPVITEFASYATPVNYGFGGARDWGMRVARGRYVAIIADSSGILLAG